MRAERESGTQVPWAAHGQELLEPPRPLLLRVELTEEDVQQIQAAGAIQLKLSVPLGVAGVLYVGLKYWLGDELPEAVLYALLVGAVLANGLLGFLRAKKHYTQPGALALTLSADGVELSTEAYSGHIPWGQISGISVRDALLVIRTRGTPSFHACPLRGLSAADAELLATWLAFRAQHTPPRRGRVLWAILALGLLALAALWGWERFLEPLINP